MKMQKKKKFAYYAIKAQGTTNKLEWMQYSVRQLQLFQL